MGATRRDYEAIAPANSFIHVDDFAGPQQLADYLHVLAANDTLYSDYFHWRDETSWSSVDLRYWCRLCALLHWRDDVDYVSWYDDYEMWWNGACQRDDDAPWFQRNIVKVVMTNEVALHRPSLISLWLTVSLVTSHLLLL